MRVTAMTRMREQLRERRSFVGSARARQVEQECSPSFPLSLISDSQDFDHTQHAGAEPRTAHVQLLVLVFRILDFCTLYQQQKPQLSTTQGRIPRGACVRAWVFCLLGDNLDGGFAWTFVLDMFSTTPPPPAPRGVCGWFCAFWASFLASLRPHTAPISP